MKVIFYFIIFLFGLVVGSFLNCVIYRLGTSGLGGRSFCPHCRQGLKWRDLVPVFSFIILRGKCRYCQQKISLQYPLVEIATGILFVLIFSFSPFGGPAVGWEFIAYFLFLILNSSFLILIFVYDLKHFIIPDKIVYPAILIVLIFRILELIQNSKFEIQNLNPVFAAFGAALFFLFIVLVSRGKWMGVGDIKLAFLMGFFLSFPNILVALFFAFLIGAIIGVGLILAKRKTLKSEVPFGPFLITGTFIALFLGQKIIQWYWNLFII